VTDGCGIVEGCPMDVTTSSTAAPNGLLTEFADCILVLTLLYVEGGEGSREAVEPSMVRVRGRNASIC